MRIGIDVDMTVVDTGSEWLRFLENKAEREIHTPARDIPYNLGELVPELSSEEVMSFWYCRNLYDKLEPIRGAMEAIKKLHDKGHDIIFVSHVMGDHYRSKKNFVDRFFPFHKGFVATEGKHLVKMDVLIDDRNSNLNACEREGIIPLRYDTPYSQCQEGDHYYMNSWDIVCVDLVDEWLFMYREEYVA